MRLDDDAARLAKGPNLAVLVTLMPDGQPQALPTWIDTDGEHILVNTEPQRQKSQNIRRNPRVTVLLQTAEDPWDWAEVRGRVTETVDGQRARDHIDELSRRYLGHEFDAPVGPHGRVIFVITPEKINTPRKMGRR